MQIFIFLLFCSLIRFNLFAEVPIAEAREAGGGLLVTNSAGKVYRNTAIPTWEDSQPIIPQEEIKEPEQKSSGISMLDAVDIERQQVEQKEGRWIPVEEKQKTGKGVTWLDPDIPPPITNNNFKIVFPKLYTRDNYLVMTNAQFSRRYRRTLSFAEFTTTGCKSLDFDVTAIHPIILNYLNLSSARVIQEDKEMTRMQLQKAINELERENKTCDAD